MNASSRFGLSVASSNSFRRAGGEDLAVVDGGQPVEALGLIHVGRGHNHAHAGAVGADTLNQIPELRARQRSTPVVGSSRIRKSGS